MNLTYLHLGIIGALTMMSIFSLVLSSQIDCNKVTQKVYEATIYYNETHNSFNQYKIDCNNYSTFFNIFGYVTGLIALIVFAHALLISDPKVVKK